MAECLKKPFKDSLDDIKERMKEKRNQKWMRLGKSSQPFLPFTATAKGKRATNSSMQMKSIQANNRALALALQEEKIKLRDAQVTILRLRRDYQDLKFQMFDLQRALSFQQAQRLVENQLSSLNEVISKVSQNLLDSIDLLGPAKNLCSIGLNQRMLSSVLEGSSSVAEQTHSVGILQCAIGDDQVLPSGMEADSDRNELAHSVSTICEEPDNATSFIKIVPDKGRTSDFHLDDIGSELEDVSSSGEDRFGNTLPKSVSIRRCRSAMRNHYELCTGVLDRSEAPDSTRELSKQDEIRLEESLERCAIENINSDVSQLNENKVGSKPASRRAESETTEFNLDDNSDLKHKQRECKSRDDSQVRREKHSKRKLEWPKSTSKQRPKQRQRKEASKEKLDFLGGSNDAYDFHFEERVHVTPFRTNKVNDTDTGKDDKDDSSETNTIESSDIEEDSDDILYEPYKSRSKKRKSSVGETDMSPVCARPRSKRCLAQREQKLHKEKETDSNKSSDSSIRQPAEPSRGHLCDVTNTASLLPSTGNATVTPEGEGPRSPKRKRSCTLSVSYKEPSIAGKLRRGDPFTDTNFLNSPIFKQKRDAKGSSLHKKSLSKYNEKFIGCC
ncbi:PREDICTED: shugoshin-like 1 [Eurypyga helias]|uniref:shugoshin-like 1 n=1 Tax=Eurypyga helias TaxID=54383 RepID=UPI0005288A86|nr:PREDICTED: shugoshin-like 1 [Eurypyga helias]